MLVKATYTQAPPKSSACSANFGSFSNKLFLTSPVSDWVCSHKPLKSNVYNNVRVRVRARARAKDRGLRPLEYSIPTASTFHTHTPSYVFSLV